MLVLTTAAIVGTTTTNDTTTTAATAATTGTSDDEKAAWGLHGDSSLYYYANQGHMQQQSVVISPNKNGPKTVTSVPSIHSMKIDKDKYGALRVDFVGLGLSPESISRVFEIVAGLLHLGEPPLHTFQILYYVVVMIVTMMIHVLHTSTQGK
jgi:hypothetical protein